MNYIQEFNSREERSFKSCINIRSTRWSWLNTTKNGASQLKAWLILFQIRQYFNDGLTGITSVFLFLFRPKDAR